MATSRQDEVVPSAALPVLTLLSVAAEAAPAMPLATATAITGSNLSVSSPAFDIVINFTGDSQYLTYFTAAERIWELVVTGDIPNDGAIDDLNIDASAIAIDGAGGILGQAGPTSIRWGSYLPSSGIMQFDSADLAGMVSNSMLQNVILHEMGHILGIGTMWGPNYWNLTNAGPDYRYTGAAALAEYRLLANNPSASFVQVENGGGQGTAGGHWDDSIFGAEVMTGYISSGSAPLSRMTLASLRDAGYTVDLGFSDPYALSSTPLALQDDYSGNYNSTTTVTVGGSVAGKIELSEDNDWFLVSLAAGTTYTVSMSAAGSSGGTLADAFLRLRALDGEVLSFDDNTGAGSDASLQFTATTSGTYYIDASAAGTGTGTYTISFTSGLFSGGDDVVALTSPNGTWDALGGNDNVTGTTGVDNIVGGSGNDTLKGGGGNDALDGGIGNDALTGGADSDTYYLDSLGDVAMESLNEGSDHVVASVNHTLRPNFENLTLTGAATTGVGNTLGNFIFGTAANNLLSGLAGADHLDGGLGADTLRGGADNDTFVLDNVGDVAVELLGEGIDTALAGVSYTARDHIENVTLTGAAANLGGNALDNALTGNGLNNLLIGRGGNDVLAGAGGVDTFMFDAALGASNIDRIVDFVAIDDAIRLSSAIFGAAGLGVLSSGEFRLGTAALDGDDRVIYDSAMGRLYFDADGSGAIVQQHFATLDSRPLTITAGDFVVI